MSRGPGHTQRAILALIAAQPDEAWTVADLCRLIYPGDLKPTRAQLSSVGRALKRVALPGKWTSGYVEGDRSMWLYRDRASVERRMWRLETIEVTYAEIGEGLLLELIDSPVDGRPKPTEPEAA